MPSVRISPGRLTALWLLLRTLKNLGGVTAEQDISSYASASSLRSGGLPIADGMVLAFEGGFVARDPDRLVVLTNIGNRALDMCGDDEPSREVRKLLLSVLLLRDPPPWVAFWQGEPESIGVIIPEPERRLLEEVGMYPLGDYDDMATRAWWDALSVSPPTEEANHQRKLIGDAGETLSLAFEIARLRADGFPELARQVRWVAQESPSWGFDILSSVGAGSTVADAPLAIEVKSMARPAVRLFELFISAHEWKTATAHASMYVVHLWDGVRPGPPPASRSPAPRIVQVPALADHIPPATPCDDPCAWASAHILLPLPA